MVLVADLTAPNLAVGSYDADGNEILRVDDAAAALYVIGDRVTGAEPERSAITFVTLTDPLIANERFAETGLAGGKHDLDPTKQYLFRVPAALDGAAKGATWDVAEQDRYELIGETTAQQEVYIQTTPTTVLEVGKFYNHYSGTLALPAAPVIGEVDWLVIGNDRDIASIGGGDLQRGIVTGPIRLPNGLDGTAFAVAPGFEFRVKYNFSIARWTSSAMVDLVVTLSNTQTTQELRGGSHYLVNGTAAGQTYRLPEQVTPSVIEITISPISTQDVAVTQFDPAAVTQQILLEDGTVNNTVILPAAYSNRTIKFIGDISTGLWKILRPWVAGAELWIPLTATEIDLTATTDSLEVYVNGSTPVGDLTLAALTGHVGKTLILHNFTSTARTFTTGQPTQDYSGAVVTAFTIGSREMFTARVEDIAGVPTLVQLPPSEPTGIPRRAYNANGALSTENQKAVFYSDTPLIMTIDSSVQDELVLIRSGNENVTITDLGGKLFRHEDPNSPGTILPSEASIILDTNSTWTVDFDVTLDRWVVSDGDTSGAPTNTPFTYRVVGSVHIQEFDNGFVRQWGRTTGASSTFVVAYKDAAALDVQVTVNNSSVRYVHVAALSTTRVDFVREGGTAAEVMWVAFGEKA